MLQKIKKETAVEKVSQQLRALIENGEFKAGDKLPSERKLCELMAVSRIAIREAIRGLEARNILEVHPGDGTYVKSVTASDLVDPLTAKLIGDYTLKELLEFRHIIEVAVVGLAAERATEADLAEMREELAAMEKGVETVDYLEPDYAFHNTIARASNNRFFQLTIEQFGDVIRTAIREASEDQNAPRSIYNIHHKIYEKIRDHDVSGAQSFMAKHIQREEEDLLGYHKRRNTKKK